MTPFPNATERGPDQAVSAIGNSALSLNGSSSVCRAKTAAVSTFTRVCPEPVLANDRNFYTKMARQRVVPHHRQAVEPKNGLVIEFSLCLSLACLGKMFVVHLNGSKRPFFVEPPGEPGRAHRQIRRASDEAGRVRARRFAVDFAPDGRFQCGAFACRHAGSSAFPNVS